MSQPSEFERSFISFIREKILPDTGSRAILKRALRGDPRFIASAMKFVAPFHPRPGWDEEAFMIVGGLYAIHPVDWRPTKEKPNTGDFGNSMAIFASQNYGGGSDRRFARLIDVGVRAGYETLRGLLFSMIMLIKRDHVPVDWAQLLHDLRRWDSPDKWVQRRWARSYYATLDRRLLA